MLEEFIRDDDIIEIHKQTMVFQKKNKTLFRVPIKKILSETTIVIQYPQEGEQELEPQICYEAYIYSSQRVYRCCLYYIQRYMEGEQETAVLQIVSPLERVQRRIYQRQLLSSDIYFFWLTKEEMSEHHENSVSFLAKLRDEKIASRFRPAHLLDISGGGMRLLIPAAWEEKDTVRTGEMLILLTPHTEMISEKIFLTGHVVFATKDIDPQNDIVHVSFMQISEEDREQIIHYGFEQEAVQLQSVPVKS
jgi:hypothetical protein